MQWGRTPSSTSSGSITFSLSFSTCYGIQLQECSDRTRAWAIYSVSKTGFSYVLSASDYAYYLAIGK